MLVCHNLNDTRQLVRTKINTRGMNNGTSLISLFEMYRIEITFMLDCYLGYHTNILYNLSIQIAITILFVEHMYVSEECLETFSVFNYFRFGQI